MLDISNIGMERWKRSKWWLVLAFVLIAAGAYGNWRTVFGDTVATVLIAVGTGMLFANLLRGVIYKDEDMMADEMTRRISGESSDVAFVVAIAATGVLSAAVHYYPGIMDANKALTSLMGVLVLSKLAAQFYYKRMKKEV